MTQAFDASFASIDPAELAAQLERGDRIRLVDVREHLESRIASVKGAELVPLGTLPDAVDRFELDEEIVVMCHTGIRSQMACEFLLQSGFRRVRNLSGGIDRWSLEVDPTVARY